MTSGVIRTTGTQQRAIVIGAGIGGLCAAIRLAVAGLSVTLIEAQAAPGGKMRCLPSAAGPIDAGPTVLTLRAVFDEVFSAAGEDLDDHVTLVPQPVLARHFWQDGSRLDLFADHEASAEAIAAFAGARAEGDFRRFNRLSADLFRAFDGPVMRARKPSVAGIFLNTLRSPAIWPAVNRTLARQLASNFADPRLRQLFGRYATYVGGAPDLSPAVLALIWRAEAEGVWSVQGGMHALARALADLAVRSGVTIRYGTVAQKILSQSGRVSGVATSDAHMLACDAVVFNGDPAALLAGLLGNGPQQALKPSAAHPRSLSAYVWSFAATPSSLPMVHHNVFFCSDPSDEFGPIAQGRIPSEATLYVCAQDRTGGPHSGAERFEIIMNAPAKSSLSLKEVEECRTKTFPQLARFGLTFDLQPPNKALTTPHDFAQLFPGSQGALYGRSPQSTLASFQRPTARTSLPGLYLAGGGVHPGAGVPMAALSGKHAAEAILSDLTSGSRFGRTVTRGGTSTASRPTGHARSP